VKSHGFYLGKYGKTYRHRIAPGYTKGKTNNPFRVDVFLMHLPQVAAVAIRILSLRGK